jgi:prolipoprotein diacylglyceryl transferase
MLNRLSVLASLPSPSSGSLEVGPLRLNAYGAIIAVGVVVAVMVTGRRFEKRGIAKREDASSIALWAVPAGVIGGRLYHVITDWERFRDDPLRAIEIWKGGLGIWGAIALGVLVGVLVAKGKSIPIAAALTCVAPALAFAQSIGRWGNWFNQELFGRATTLPWGLEIDDRHLPEGFASGTLFHPTFLYESIGCALLGFGLIAFDRRKPLRDGALFAWYVAGYTAMRFFIEGLRIDPAREAGGLRLNQWTSLVVFVVALGFIVKMRGARAHGQILDDAQ